MRDATLWFEIVSKDILVAFMDDREVSVRGLAARCVVKDRAGRRKVLSPATIGRMRTGSLTTCSPPVAFAIERALRVPPNVVFQPRSLRKAA